MSARKPDMFEDILWSLETTAESALPGSVPELAAFDPAAAELLGALAEASPGAAAPDDLFDRIEARIDAPEIEGVETVDADAGAWLDRGNGVWLKRKAAAPDGKNIYLLRCKPGALIPAHKHKSWEYALVLEGRFQIAGRTVRAGDAQYSVANSFHPEITTDIGCLLLVVA
ncbi:MAG: cupin domain-containing protein [Boseongicola sp.]|nr:cupin domain-containing protein [Boseongicola sp.]